MSSVAKDSKAYPKVKLQLEKIKTIAQFWWAVRGVTEEDWATYCTNAAFEVQFVILKAHYLYLATR